MDRAPRESTRTIQGLGAASLAAGVRQASRGAGVEKDRRAAVNCAPRESTRTKQVLGAAALAAGVRMVNIAGGVVSTQLVPALQSNAIMDSTLVDLSVSSARDAPQGNIVKDAQENQAVPVLHALTALIRRHRDLGAAALAAGVLQDSTAKAVWQVQREAVNLALLANTRRHRDLQHVRSARPANILL